MTRRYGRAPRALGSHGVEAVMTIDGATDAEVFRVYVEQVLCPTLHPGDMVMAKTFPV